MPRSTVALVTTSPPAVGGDTHALVNLSGCQEAGDAPAEVTRAGMHAFTQPPGIPGTCLKKAPEFGRSRRTISTATEGTDMQIKGHSR